MTDRQSRRCRHDNPEWQDILVQRTETTVYSVRWGEEDGKRYFVVDWTDGEIVDSLPIEVHCAYCATPLELDVRTD